MNVAVTFDNLGEASDLERGWWPEDEPLGAHHSVTQALPRVLAALDDAGLRATFFVEGLNTELYPDTLRELVYEHVRQIVTRYRRAVSRWIVASGLHVNESFGFTFEQLMDLTRVCMMVVRKLHPAAGDF